jgi:hypothetical protein
MAAALAAGAGMAGAAGMAAPETAKASSPPVWNLIFQPHNSGYFASIAAISRTDVWAVADIFQRGKVVYKPYIRRFNGSTWTAVTIPGARMTSNAVQATSASDIWVFGLTPNSQNLASSAAYRWDGRVWHKVPVPRDTYLQGTVVLSASNVWAFGGSFTLHGDVFHWNGRKWASYDVNSVKLIPQDVAASSPRNVWLTGMTLAGRKERAAAYRWDGSRWFAVSTPHPVVDAGPSVTVISRSNVWIAWDTTITTRAAHWDGRQWRVVTAPDNLVSTGDIVSDGRGGYWFGPFADWTGRGWINAGAISPQPNRAGFGVIVRIPGTLSFLMAAGVANTASSAQHPTIYRLDLGVGAAV